MTDELVLVDTNVLVYLLGGDNKAARALQSTEVHVSFVTEIELQSHKSLTTQDLVRINEVLSRCRISDVNPTIKNLASLLRRRHGLRLGDAIIAATALHLNIPLLTADIGFGRLGKVISVRMF